MGIFFLEDLRKYREEKLAERNFQAVFPLWKFNTQALAHEFIAAGFKTKICAASAELINENQVGIDFSEDFFRITARLVDPCGENGEFHSFCYAGPVFARPLDIYLEKVLSQTYQIPLENGTIQQKKYWFADIRISNSGF
ncbi:hypothetical protein [Algoriphagus boritolerans]|uniref:Dph6-related ATP pyrophosphatase n=1 Tax=Algoriphagus boritolerans TaxID=308111 RepID=UPI000AD1FFDA